MSLPRSLEAQGDWLPDAQTVREGIDRAEREEVERERDLENPEAAEERKRSRDAFVGLDPEEAEALLRAEFAAQLRKLNADPARSLGRADEVRPLGEDAAVVVEDGDRALLESGVPVKTRDESGELRLLDVGLKPAGNGFETANALVEVGVGGSAAEPVTVGDEGLSIAQAGARPASSTRRFGEQNAFQHEAFADTDTVISPTAAGVEIFQLLRSERSPEDFAYDFDPPTGAELRGFAGGAEVVRDGKRIALVPTPTAVDSQGSDVPVNVVVEGDSLRLETSHRSGDYAYPILLDPILDVWNWIEGFGYDGLGAWAWDSQPKGSPVIWPETGLNCYYSCWGRGLYLTAPNGAYAANQFTHWVYSAPNEHSYVENVNLAIFARDEHGCSSPPYNQPHDYAGYVDNSGAWQPWAGNPYMNGSELLHLLLAGWGRAYVVGVGTGPGASIPCWRDFYVGVAGVWLDDWNNPVINSLTGVPSGWIDGDTRYPLTVSVTDAGLGVSRVKLLPDGKPIADEDPVGNCTGVATNRCPNNHVSHLELVGASLGEGVRTAGVSALDPTAKASAWPAFQTKVDYSKPRVSLDGQLAVATEADEGEAKGDEEVEKLNLPVYNLQIQATDEGEETDPQKRKRSGVEDIEVWLEEEGQPTKEMPVPWKPTPSCAASCPKEGTYKLELSKLDAAGTHRLEVRVTDFAGNEKTRDIEFEYFPATGMKDEYVMHHFPLPDGQGDEDEEEHPKRPELAVNVMNGNLVYRQVDVDLETSAQVDLELERYYNSQLPDSESGEWGEGWTLAETPELHPDGSVTALAAAATMTQDPSLTQRYFSLWLNMPSPESTRAGYELRFRLVGTDSYDVGLSKWEGGSETTLGSKAGVSFADGDSLALVDEGSTVSAWTDTGSGFAPLLSVGDSTFEQGRAGLHGSGNIVRLADFKAGELGAPSNVASGLTALPATEPFDGGAASNERFAGEWTALGWAGGGGSAKGGNTSAGWRPLSAYSTINGAFHHQNLDGSGVVPEEGELLESSGAVESEVALPTEEGQEEFDPELRATVKKKAGGGYLMTDETGASATTVAFDAGGQAEALVTESEARVDYSYEGGELAEIAVEDPGTLVTDEPTEIETSEPEPTDGTPLFHASFGSAGSGDAEFDKPVDVALGRDGDIWIADYDNHRIQRFNPAGEFIDEFGSEGSGDGQLNRPASIAIHAEGDIWVADKHNYRIQEFSPTGEYIGQFGHSGSGDGELDRPEGIAIDGDGVIWVSDTYNYRVQKFDTEGDFIEVVEPEGLGAIEPTGIAAGPDGKVWIADWAHNRVAVVDGNGDYEFSFGSGGGGPGEFERPDAIDVAPSGDVWVGDEDDRLQRFDSEGDYVDEIGSSGSGPGEFNVSFPFGFAAGEDRRLWVADRNNHRVQRWDPPFEVAEEPLPEDDDPSIELDHDGGLVETVSGEEAGEHFYEHENGFLVSHDGPDGETIYEKAGETDMLGKVTLPNGTYAEISYFDDGRVESVTVDPAGEEPAQTTNFAYTDAPNRRTEVEVPGAPNLTYDIGADGSVLKWWNTAGPPDLELSGTLYVNKEKEGGISPGDHELQGWAEEEEGVESLEIIVGDTVVEELTCSQVGGPPPECTKTEILPWVMETEAFAPGRLWIEVIATDTDQESTSERFWIDIPEPPPPSPNGGPQAPRFSVIKSFREEYGLEIVFPVANQIERNERIFNLIKAWHEPTTPAGQMARASWERWGVPLRPEDVAELEYREAYVAQAATAIPEWANANVGPALYAGYYVDHREGGILHVGFTSPSQADLAQALGQSGALTAPVDRVEAFPYQPQNSHSQDLGAIFASIPQAVSNQPEVLAILTKAGINTRDNKVVIGTTDPAGASSYFSAVYGASAPIEFEYTSHKPAKRFRTRSKNNRLYAGDAIRKYKTIYANEGCTLGFGGAERLGTKPNGQPTFKHFALTAGHCWPKGVEIARFTDEGEVRLGKVQRRTIGQVLNGVETDGAAIRLTGGIEVPKWIYASSSVQYRVTGSERTVLGSTLCVSGAKYAQAPQCGIATEPFVAFPGEYPGEYVVETTAISTQGDSGGPVWNIQTGKAVGLIQGGYEATGPTWYTPLEAVTLPTGQVHPGLIEQIDAPGGGSLNIAR